MFVFYRYNDVNLEELNDGIFKDEEKVVLLEVGFFVSGVVLVVIVFV